MKNFKFFRTTYTPFDEITVPNDITNEWLRKSFKKGWRAREQELNISDCPYYGISRIHWYRGYTSCLINESVNPVF